MIYIEERKREGKKELRRIFGCLFCFLGFSLAKPLPQMPQNTGKLVFLLSQPPQQKQKTKKQNQKKQNKRKKHQKRNITLNQTKPKPNPNLARNCPREPRADPRNSHSLLEFSDPKGFCGKGVPVMKCHKIQGIFKGGLRKGGGFHTLVRGTMFVRNGAVTPGPSRECDITLFVKGRPKSARQSRDSTVAARGVQSVTVPSSRVSRECRSPRLRSPPL